MKVGGFKTQVQFVAQTCGLLLQYSYSQLIVDTWQFNAPEALANASGYSGSLGLRFSICDHEQ